MVSCNNSTNNFSNDFFNINRRLLNFISFERSHLSEFSNLERFVKKYFFTLKNVFLFTLLS